MKADDFDSNVIDQLTRVKSKKETYKFDSFYRESFYQYFTQSNFVLDENNIIFKTSLVLIRPDALALKKGTKIVDELTKLGYKPIYQKIIKVDRVLLRELWKHSYMQASIDRIYIQERIFELSEVILILFLGDNLSSFPASVDVSLRKGSAKKEKQKRDDIRAIVGTPNRFLSLFHTADEPADLIRELGILLNWTERDFLFKFLTNKKSEFRSLTAQVKKNIVKLEQELSLNIKCNHNISQQETLNKNGIPLECHLKVKNVKNSNMTLCKLDREIERGGCTCVYPSKWISAILAGERISSIDNNINGSFEKFNKYW